jgi:hypothetical protein
MRRLICLTACLALLLVAGCGGDDETTTPAGTSGATGAQDSAGDFMTAKEFIDASLPDQIEEVETIVGITPQCEGVDAKPGEKFQVAVAINAAQAQPDTPVEDIVSDQCGGG